MNDARSASSRTMAAAKRLLRLPYRVVMRPLARAALERGGPDTSRRVDLDELGLGGPERERYEPSGWFVLRRAFRGMLITPQDVFVDFGSGMGRVVVQAAAYPFKRVVGVELAAELTALAQENVDRRRRSLRAADIELVTSDVLLYHVPDDMTVAYAHNPFGGETFRHLLENIVRSVDRSPRRVCFIYANPVLHKEVMSTGRFALVRRSRGLRPDVRSRAINVYEVTGAATLAEGAAWCVEGSGVK